MKKEKEAQMPKLEDVMLSICGIILIFLGIFLVIKGLATSPKLLKCTTFVLIVLLIVLAFVYRKHLKEMILNGVNTIVHGSKYEKEMLILTVNGYICLLIGVSIGLGCIISAF